MRAIWVLTLTGYLTIFCSGCDTSPAEEGKDTKQKKEKKGKNGKKGTKETEPFSAGITIEKKWEMPDILQEISGFAYLSPDRFACVQDEAGAIFIFNTAQDKIEKQISFGAAGDYEGLAIAGKTAYVVRSDGQLFRMKNFETREKPEIKSFTTGLTAKNNVEGITYDQKNNRLLLVIKGAETGEKNYKGIYAFDLATEKLKAEPVYRLDLTDSVFKNRPVKNLNSAIQPSDIAINPVTGEIYVLEGTNPQLVILDNEGKIKSRFVLDKQEFKQPEGITFGPNGELFICNEGDKAPGNILRITVTEPEE